MVSGRNGRHHEAITAANREEAMNPVIIQAIALDRDRAMRERAAARQRAAECRGTRAGWPGRWLGSPAPGRGPASRTARRPWRDRVAAVLVALTESQTG